jgi:hypothetical protein
MTGVVLSVFFNFLRSLRATSGVRLLRWQTVNDGIDRAYTSKLSTAASISALSATEQVRLPG